MRLCNDAAVQRRYRRSMRCTVPPAATTAPYSTIFSIEKTLKSAWVDASSNFWNPDKDEWDDTLLR